LIDFENAGRSVVIICTGVHTSPEWPHLSSKWGDA